MKTSQKRGRLLQSWNASINDYVISMAWSPDGAILAAAGISGPIALIDAGSGATLRTLPGHGFGTTAIAWRPDGDVLTSAGQDGTVRHWDPGTGDETAALPGGSAWVERIAWGSTGSAGTWLLASAAGRAVRIWDADGQLLRELPQHSSTVADIKWKPGEPVLASAAYGGITLWVPASAEPVDKLEWTSSVLAAEWSPDGRILAKGDQDATVHFWFLDRREELFMSGYPTKVRELSIDPSSRYLATGGGDRVTV